MPFSRVSAPNLADAAAHQIRELIALDVLGPGDALPGERDLAEQMGISRTSLRAALQTLVSEGLLVTRQGAGLRVVDGLGATLADPLVTLLESVPDALSDYLRFRMILEGAAACEAAERAQAEERAEIERAHDWMQEAVEAGDLKKAATADADFHMAVVEATHNVVSIQVARSLHTILLSGVERSHRLTNHDPAAWADLAAQHTPIRDAILAGDGPAAEQAMVRHLGFQEDLLKREAVDARRRDVARKRAIWARQQG